MRCRLKKTNKRLEEQSGDERPGVSARALSLPPYHAIPHFYHSISYHTVLYHFIPYRTIPYHTITYHTKLYHTILSLPPCSGLDNGHATCPHPTLSTLSNPPLCEYADLNSNFPPRCFGISLFDFSWALVPDVPLYNNYLF